MKQFGAGIEFGSVVDPIVEHMPAVCLRDSTKAVMVSAGKLLDEADVLIDQQIIRRPAGLRGNQLGLIGHVAGVGAEVEAHRGAEGFSPATVKALYPNDLLSTSVLQDIVRNYDTWNDRSQDPTSEW